jgi:hypothetical protein
MTVRVALASFIILLPVGSLAAAPATAPVAVAEQLRSAKALFFDGKYAEARTAWAAVRAASKGAESVTALYWIARCSEKLGEQDRALTEYAAFLAAVGAAVSLTSVGADNTYGHPSARTLTAAAPTSFRTDLHGDLALVHRGGGLAVVTAR